LDRRAGAALVGDRRQRRAGRLERQPGPVVVALALEVLRRHLALRLRAAGDEEDRDAAGLGVVEDLQGLLDRDADLVRRLGLRLGAEREPVGDDRRVVRERGLVDVEDDRALARALAVIVVPAVTGLPRRSRHAGRLVARLAGRLARRVRVRAAPPLALHPRVGEVIDLGDLVVVRAAVV